MLFTFIFFFHNRVLERTVPFLENQKRLQNVTLIHALWTVALENGASMENVQNLAAVECRADLENATTQNLHTVGSPVMAPQRRRVNVTPKGALLMGN